MRSNTAASLPWQAPRAPDSLELDLEALWKDYPDIPAPPPCLAAGHSIPPQTSAALLLSPRPEIEYIFFSIPGSVHGFYWFGPDPLASETRGEDIFSHIEWFTFLGDILWVEFELSKVSLATGKVMERNLFYLPRRESALGNMTQVRQRLHSHIAGYDYQTITGLCRLRLSIYPRQGLFPHSETQSKLLCDSRCDGSVLDPGFFVENITANFQ